MEDVFTNLISQFGYIGVWFLIFFENVFPPIPSELILPLSGFFTTTTELTLPGVIIAATIGSVTGAYILYGVGRILSRERLMTFFGTRPMRLLGFKPDDIASAVDWFDRKGQATVLICRCVPIVRSLISIPAGTAKMNMVRFALYTLVGSLVWNAILCTLGFWAGGAWEQITAQAEWVSDVVKVVIIVVAVGVVAWWVKFRILPARAEQKRREAEGK